LCSLDTAAAAAVDTFEPLSNVTNQELALTHSYNQSINQATNQPSNQPIKHFLCGNTARTTKKSYSVVKVRGLGGGG